MITFDEIVKLHSELWPDVTLDGQLAKFDEEHNEYKQALYGTEESLYELADMIIVSAGIARFDYTYAMGLLSDMLYTAEFSISDIWEAVEKKLEKNRNRKWGKNKEGLYHHI